jgi:GT2 family glycosyltransferase
MRGRVKPIAIVMVNFRNAEDTVACLDSLAASGAEGIRVHLIENGSGDGSDATLAAYAAAARFPMVYESTGENLGFAGGSNRGIAKALEMGCSHIVLLNNDTLVEPGFCPALRAAAAREPEAVVAGFISEVGTGRPSYNIGWIGAWTGLIRFHFGERNVPAPGIDFVSAGLMMVPAGVFARLGGLRDDFFLYCEDLEFCLRCKDAGVPLIYDPAIAVAHRVSSSVTKTAFPKDYYRMRNQTWLAMRRGGPLRKAVYLIRIAGTLLKNAGNRSLARQFGMGVRDGILGRLGRNPRART